LSGPCPCGNMRRIFGKRMRRGIPMRYETEASFTETIYSNVDELSLSPIYEVINKAVPIGL